MFNDDQVSKFERLVKSGINPYPNGFEKPAYLPDIISELREMSVLKLNKEPHFILAGRLRFKNDIGGMGFARIESDGAVIQLCIRKNALVQITDFQIWKALDLGDLVWVKGPLMRTRTGELSLDVRDLKLYAKCLEGMPDKVAGVSDVETKQRMRYLDLMVNADSRERFALRSSIISQTRRYLEDMRFMEVETPSLQVIPGGASARPFVTHHNSLDTDLYLRIAPELYLKRLLVGGFSNVFEIGKNFRNEGISTKHNPEFTTVEFYAAHCTFMDLMPIIKKLFNNLITKLRLSWIINFDGSKINLAEWRQISYEELLREAGVSDPWSVESLQGFLSDQLGVEPNNFSSEFSVLWEQIFDRFIEKKLINPTFVTHFPTAISPLARRSDSDSRVTDRFELYIAGMEIANGFSELNDPFDQAERFMKQVEQKNAGDNEAMYFDQDYIKALLYGMPPCAGAGIGLDRLVMLLTQTTNIRDVILFPTMKSKGA